MPSPPQLQPQPCQCRCPPEARGSSNLSSGCFGCRFQWFRCDCRVVEQVAIGGGNGQTTCDYNGTTNLLNRLNFPTPTRGTMVKVTGNGVPRAVGKGRCALLSGLQVPRVNRAGQIRQGFSGGAHGELDGSGCLSAVAGCLEHWIDSLWSSVFQS
jgi:hypothetical protein